VDGVRTFGDVRPGGFADAKDLCTKSMVSEWKAEVCYGNTRKFRRLWLVGTTLLVDSRREDMFCCVGAHLQRSIPLEP
jgi:hypothetical protein